MQDSVFTRIIRGDIPAHKVYEDARTLAFLDIAPLVPGHILVVPKMQVDHLDDLPDEDYDALMRAVKKLAKHARTMLQTQRSIIHIFGFDIPHAHVHILPADTGEEYFEAITNHLASVNDGKPYPYKPTDEDLAAMAATLRMENES